MSNFFDAAKVEAAPSFELAEVFATPDPQPGSPIDIYYGRARALIARASKADEDGEADLISLLFLRLISATESYFRDILAQLPLFCPICRGESSKVTLVLGAGYHYRQGGMALAVLEHVSFCSKGELARQTKKMTGFVCDSDSSLREAIAAFESISQLRHAIVHAYDHIYFNNLFELGLAGKVVDGSLVRIRPIDFQRFVSVCHAVVRAFNRALLDHVIKKWVDARVVSNDWSVDESLFSKLFELFRSVEDGVAPSSARDAFSRVFTVPAD